MKCRLMVIERNGTDSDAVDIGVVREVFTAIDQRVLDGPVGGYVWSEEEDRARTVYGDDLLAVRGVDITVPNGDVDAAFAVTEVCC